MIPKRILSLDVSSKTGWALVISSKDGYILEEYGLIPKTSEPKGKYPGNYVAWAYQIFGDIVALIDRLEPDMLAIEETVAGSKSVMSQKILEYTHFLLARLISRTGIDATYFLTGQWRVETGCVMSAEEKKKNKEVRDYKKKKQKQTGAKPTVAYDIKGKRIGLVGKKHVNVRRANEIFGSQLKEPLKKKDEDIADALLLSFALHQRRLK